MQLDGMTVSIKSFGCLEVIVMASLVKQTDMVKACDYCCLVQFHTPLIKHLCLGKCSDLWKYHINSNTWTSVIGNNTIDLPGIYDPPRVPGARRSAVGWYDSSERALWLFGGLGFGNSSDNDGA